MEGPDPHAMKEKFWHALSNAPVVFLELDDERGTAVPMTAQLDKDADSAIWFFTGKDHHLARLGNATCTYTGKHHNLFARFHGRLSVEESRERLDRHWSNFVEAWYPGGKDDPNLLLLRMDLGEAEIWDEDVGLMTAAKMAWGKDVRDDVKDQHVATTL
jgi:general stress protein 26